MYVITTNAGTTTTYYFSYWNKWGMPVYVPEIERARKYETRKEASFDRQKGDKVVRV